jgi:hypothetical protein
MIMGKKWSCIVFEMASHELISSNTKMTYRYYNVCEFVDKDFAEICAQPVEFLRIDAWKVN